jgi:hypothetical protein
MEKAQILRAGDVLILLGQQTERHESNIAIKKKMLRLTCCILLTKLSIFNFNHKK